MAKTSDTKKTAVKKTTSTKATAKNITSKKSQTKKITTAVKKATAIVLSRMVYLFKNIPLALLRQLLLVFWEVA